MPPSGAGKPTPANKLSSSRPANASRLSNRSGSRAGRRSPLERREREKADTPEDKATPHGQRYEVGYGKPPRHTRFEKGRSGNPRGRPKSSKNLATLLAAALD